MSKLPIVQALAQRSITLGEMMGDTKGTDAMVSRLLLAAVDVIQAADVHTKHQSDISLEQLKGRLLEFDERAGQIFKENQDG